MNALRIVLTIVMIAISVIIMQEGKDQGLGAISGAAETYWGKNKGRSMEGNLLRWTVILVIAFFALAMLLNMSIF